MPAASRPAPSSSPSRPFPRTVSRLPNHKDINDIDQTVTVKTPVIGTTAVDAADGDKTVTGEENVSVRDTVHYNNVTPGKTYKVTGTLYEKVTDKDGKVSKKVFKDKNGNPITAGS